MSSLSGIGGRLYRGETSIDFVGKRRRWYALSGIVIVLSAIVLGTQGLHLGIEFKGGSEFSITKPGVTVEQGRAAIAQAGVSGESVVQIVGNDRVRIQTGALESFNSVKESLAQIIIKQVAEAL
jgi:preprotein translocase subunit SecF